MAVCSALLTTSRWPSALAKGVLAPSSSKLPCALLLHYFLRLAAGYLADGCLANSTLLTTPLDCSHSGTASQGPTLYRNPLLSSLRVQPPTMPSFTRHLARQPSVPPLAAAPLGIRRERSPRRAAAPPPAPALTIPEGMGYLEVRSVSNEVAMDYYRRLKELTAWATGYYPSVLALASIIQWPAGPPSLRQALPLLAKPAALLLIDDEAFDTVVVSFMDYLHFQGRPAAHGEKLIAAIAFFLPAFGKYGRSGLPRAARSLRGWRKLMPPLTRLPLPWLPFLAIVHRIMAISWEAAICLLLTYHCYLRPMESESLTAGQVVWAHSADGQRVHQLGLILAPMHLAKATKTGQWEEAVLVDQMPEIILPLIWLKSQRAANDCLWPFRPGHLAALLREHSQALQLDALGITAYSLRHGGASHDLLRRARPLAEVKRRGRWLSDSSLKRYSKETKLIEVVSRLPAAALALGQFFHDHLSSEIIRLAPHGFKQWARTGQ